MTIDYDKLTDEIMAGMVESDTEGSGLSRQVLKTEIGDTILGRFVLLKTSPKDSLYHYFHHGWKTSSGQYLSYLCPSTDKETCPICRKSIGFWKSNDPFLVDASKKIRRKENWLVNMYIIDDSKHPENNGKIKIFRFGKQIKAVIDEATTGVDKDIFGKNIWRLDSKGCNFRITVKPNSDKKDAWPSYTTSKFLPPSDLGLDESEIKALIDNTHKINEFYERKLDHDELVGELQKNFIDDLQRQEDEYESHTLGTVKSSAKQKSQDAIDVDDDLDFSVKPKVKETAPDALEKATEKVDTSSDEIDKMLEELG